jgi:hypothetical protein
LFHLLFWSRAPEQPCDFTGAVPFCNILACLKAQLLAENTIPEDVVDACAHLGSIHVLNF